MKIIIRAPNTSLAFVAISAMCVNNVMQFATPTPPLNTCVRGAHYIDVMCVSTGVIMHMDIVLVALVSMAQFA